MDDSPPATLGQGNISMFQQIQRAINFTIGLKQDDSSAPSPSTAMPTPSYPPATPVADPAPASEATQTSSLPKPSSSLLGLQTKTNEMVRTMSVESPRPPASAPPAKGKGKRPLPAPFAEKSNTSRKRHKHIDQAIDETLIPVIPPAVRGTVQNSSPKSKEQRRLGRPKDLDSTPLANLTRQSLPQSPELPYDHTGNREPEADKENHAEEPDADEEQEDAQHRLVKIIMEAQPEHASEDPAPPGLLHSPRESPALPPVESPSDDEDIEDAGEGDEGEEEHPMTWEISEFRSHRLNKDLTVDIEVKWDNFERTTWEPESILQEDQPELLYEYWAGDTGDANRRTTILFGSEDKAEYHVFKVTDHKRPGRGSRNGCLVYVQWVGYPESENCWEPESKVKDIAPMQLDDYWESVGGRDLFIKDGRRKEGKKVRGQGR